MPIEKVTGTDLEYLLISFDAEGREREDDPNGRMSRRALEEVSDSEVTDVFLFSHGWKGDVPAARDQYDRWIRAMLQCEEDRRLIREERSGFKPLLIGLHWPSQPWGDEELGGGAGVSFEPATAAVPPVEGLIDAYAERIADTPRAREALRVIFDAARRDISPSTLPPEVQEAYKVLDEEAGLGTEREAGAPGNDREPFNPEFSFQAAKEDEAMMSFGGMRWGGLLSPLRQLSFWRMKDRARKFGETGGSQLLGDLQRAARREVKFHLMGHSFGCIVISAMIAGPRSQSQLARPVNSVFLVQGALSIWSYCSDIPSAPGQPGYFRSIVADRRVQGPIVTTQSSFDTAVGRFYPIGAGMRGQVVFAPGEPPKYGALGAFGVRGPGAPAIDLKMLPADQPYDFEPGTIYNLNSSGFINQGTGASGAHSDIAKREVAHAFWEAVRSGAKQ